MQLPVFFELAIQLAQILAKLQLKAIVHGDLRPENIFVCPDTGKVQIIGFEKEFVFSEKKESLKYAAPEKLGLGRSDCRSDYYSLGVIFYQLWTGHLPLEAEDAAGWLQVHTRKRPKNLSELNPFLPSALVEMVMKLLAKDPGHRYQTAAGLVRDLTACRKQWQETGRIQLTPGEQEVSPYFSAGG